MLFFLSLIETDEERDLLEKIYCEHLDWMFKIAFHFLKNKEDSEDVIQDVFINLVKTEADIPYDDEERLRAYLFICIRNTALRCNRIKKKYKSEFLFNISTKEDVQDELIEKSIYDEVLSYINTMSPIYKDVLVLNIVYEKTINEIAKILSSPRKTIETRLRRGKALIKKKFKEFDV